MWMNGSSWRRSTPAKARRTGKPSPSNPDGAVVTETTGRSTVVAASGSLTRGRTRMSSTVTAGMVTPHVTGPDRPLVHAVTTLVDDATFLTSDNFPERGMAAAELTATDRMRLAR